MITVFYLFAVSVDCGQPGETESCWDVCGVCGGDNSTCRPKSVYYHWGSDFCPKGSRLLYIGFTSR